MAGLIRGLDDAALRDRVAQATALYFLDWSHPISGMARERSGGNHGYDIQETVCTGGTGFGLLAQIVAAERGWRPRQQILDRVARVVKLTAFVNSTPDFGDQPEVVNGCSDLMVEVFGDAGRHARAAVSAPALPRGVAVEIEAIFEVA